MKLISIGLLFISASLGQLATLGVGGVGGKATVISLVATSNCMFLPNGAPCTITTTTAGSSLVLVYHNSLVVGSISGASTDQGQNATQVPSCQGSTTSAGSYDVWYILSATTGTTTVTAASIGNTHLTAYEVNVLTAVDGSCSVLNNQSASTTPQSPSITPSVNPTFIASLLSPTGVCTGIHAGNTFTNDSTLGGYCTAHLITTGAGAQQAQWDTTTNGMFGTLIVAFKH